MKPRRKGLVVPRSIIARMIERYIFNFRVTPDCLARHLPVPWLAPQVINGWSVISFCVLKLDRLTVWPLPPVGRFETISCAYRIGVIDHSGNTPEPSVYVTDRNADLPMITRLGPLLLLDSIPAVKAAIGHTTDMTHIQLSYMDGQHLFSAEARPAKDAQKLQSDVFPSVDAFADFIKGGVSSYSPSIYEGAYARVDLHKEDVAYTPLEAEIEYSWLDGVWRDAGMVFDSAVFATGARYQWTYRGLWQSA
jgi:hypothetical protein